MRYFLTLLLPAVLLLAGCQTTLTLPAASFPDHAEHFTHWQVKGRIGYDNGKDGGSAALIWQQTADNQGWLDLSGPMGFGSAHISYSPAGASLDNGKQRVEAGSPAELAQQVTGLALPIPALVWWVRGLPWPEQAVSASTYDNQGQLLDLDQAGWQLTFDKYQPQGPLVLPGRIKARQGDSRFTLLISDWQPLP